MNENSIGQIVSDHAYKLKTISAYDKKVLKISLNVELKQWVVELQNVIAAVMR